MKVLDEPLAGLDEKTKKKVMWLIKDSTKSETVIAISHDAAIMVYMDAVVDIKDL